MLLVVIFVLISYRSDNLSEAVDDAMPEPGQIIKKNQLTNSIVLRQYHYGTNFLNIIPYDYDY